MWVYALVIIVLTSLPYIVGWAQQGTDWRFSGFIFGSDDGYSYMGKMRLGARGISDFYLFYTPEAKSGAPLIFLPYIIPGRLVGLFVNDRDPALIDAMTLIFHAMRIIFDTLFIGVLYRFIAVFIHAPRTRLLALVLATLGGGFGWLLTLVGLGDWLGSAPADFFIPEGFSFQILSGLPHLALARAALLTGLMVVMGGMTRLPVGTRYIVSLRYILIAAVCWIIVGLAVPFYLVIIDCILGAWGLALWIGTRRFPLGLALVGGMSALIALPLFGYYAFVFSRDAVFAQWSAQNLLPSPHPLQYIAAYILLVIPAIIGGRCADSGVSADECAAPHGRGGDCTAGDFSRCRTALHGTSGAMETAGTSADGHGLPEFRPAAVRQPVGGAESIAPLVSACHGYSRAGLAESECRAGFDCAVHLRHGQYPPGLHQSPSVCRAWAGNDVRHRENRHYGALFQQSDERG